MMIAASERHVVHFKSETYIYGSASNFVIAPQSSICQKWKVTEMRANDVFI